MSKNKKILLTAFIVPFINMVIYLIEFSLNCKEDSELNFGCYSEFFGFYAIFLIVPFLLFLSLILPKKILKFKIEAIKTLSLMWVFGWILIFISWFLAGRIHGLIY
jgi:hypothetical protein